MSISPQGLIRIQNLYLFQILNPFKSVNFFIFVRIELTIAYI